VMNMRAGLSLGVSKAVFLVMSILMIATIQPKIRAKEMVEQTVETERDIFKRIDDEIQEERAFENIDEVNPQRADAYYVAVSNAIARVGPGYKYRRAETYYKGDRLYVFQKKNKWIKFRILGKWRYLPLSKVKKYKEQSVDYR